MSFRLLDGIDRTAGRWVAILDRLTAAEDLSAVRQPLHAEHKMLARMERQLLAGVKGDVRDGTGPNLGHRPQRINGGGVERRSPGDERDDVAGHRGRWVVAV